MGGVRGEGEEGAVVTAIFDGFWRICACLLPFCFRVFALGLEAHTWNV